MVPQNTPLNHLPIYARMRTASSGLSRAYPVVPTFSQTVHPLPVAVDESPYRLSTLAGRSDTVWHSSSFRPSKPLPIPVWRSGYKDGRSHQALFNKPTGLAVDHRGYLYVSDSLNHCIRRISPRGQVETMIGNGQKGFQDGSLRQARLNYPTGLAIDSERTLYIIDQGNQALRVYSSDGKLKSLEIPGKPTGGITVLNQNIYLFCEINSGHSAVTVLVKVNPTSTESCVLSEWEGRLQWLPYRSKEEEQPFSRWSLQRKHRPQAVTISQPQYAEGLGLTADHKGNLFWVSGYALYRLEAPHNDSAALKLHRLTLKMDFWPGVRWQGISVDNNGSVHVLDAHHHQLFRIQEDGQLSQVAERQLLNLNKPYAVVRDAYGQLYVSDTGHWRICRLVPPGQESLLQLAQQAFLPYLPPKEKLGSGQSAAPLKGLLRFMQKYMQRWRSDDEDKQVKPQTPGLAGQHLMDVLSQGNRSQQLACVKEVVDHLRSPQTRYNLKTLRPLFEHMLLHPETAVRSLTIRHICDLIHREEEALFWLELLEQHTESNRLLKKYLIEVLAYLGKQYELYGHVVPLMVEYIRSEEEDVVEYVFQQLLKIREAGYESLVDPLIEDLSAH